MPPSASRMLEAANGLWVETHCRKRGKPVSRMSVLLSIEKVGDK